MSFDIKKIIGTAAPWLATALGGPLAGQAVSMIAGAMGLKPDSKDEDIQKALAAGQLTGDQLVALKQAEQQFQLAMTQAGFSDTEHLASIAEQDRDSARQRETKVQDWTPRILAYLIVGSFIAMVGGVLGGWSKIDSALAGTLIGYLSAKCEQVVAYYYGSSIGSDRKTDLLAQAQPIDLGAKK
jgi:roadblock/LC7 domain-containing protein